MIKPIVILLASLFLFGCEGKKDTSGRIIVDDANQICINGVVYYTRYQDLMVAFNQDSTVVTCDMRNDTNGKYKDD